MERVILLRDDEEKSTQPKTKPWGAPKVRDNIKMAGGVFLETLEYI